MNDFLLFSFMALTVFFVIAIILRSAGRYKNYYAAPSVVATPRREESKPFRSQRAQEVWNRLNPKVYLDDDETEIMPQKKLGKRVKQR